MVEPRTVVPNRFRGEVALVTGAARGIGRAIALTLAAQGARVMVNDVDEASAAATASGIRASGGVASHRRADVSDEEQVAAMMEAVVQQLGPVYVLVNNAAILKPTRPLETIPVVEWDQIIAVNLRGTFLCIRQVMPMMKERHAGKIINVSSVAARSTAHLGGAHYVVSKAGVLGLTRQAALEAAPFNINVNAVAPSNTDTEMTRRYMTPESVARFIAMVPLGRRCTPQDVANVVAFLASDEASFITGAVVDVNGGSLIA